MFIFMRHKATLVNFIVKNHHVCGKCNPIEIRANIILCKRVKSCIIINIYFPIFCLYFLAL